MGVFRECSNKECLIRFPVINDDDYSSFPCPICSAQTKIVNTVILKDEAFDEKPSISVNERDLIPVLDNVRSVLNVGSIFRTANGFGINQIHLCGITPTPQHKHFHKTSLYADKTIIWEHHKNSIHHLDHLRLNGFQIISLECTETSIPINKLNPKSLSSKCALFIGNEKLGVDPEIISQSDLVVSIPMLGSKHSLNICVAFGIALYQIFHACRS